MLLLQLPKSLFWLCLAACVVWLSIAAHQTITDLDRAVLASQQQLLPTIRTLRATIDQARGTLDVVRLSALREQAYADQTARESAKTVRALRRLLDRTDRSLNDQLLPQAMSTTVDMDQQVRRLGPALDNLAQLERDADRQVANPDIEATLASLKLAAQNGAQASASLNAAAQDVSQRVHQLTRPGSMAKRAGMWVLDVLAKIGAMLGGL